MTGLRVLDYRNRIAPGGSVETVATLSDGRTIVVPWHCSTPIGASRWEARDLTAEEWAKIEPYIIEVLYD